MAKDNEARVPWHWGPGILLSLNAPAPALSVCVLAYRSADTIERFVAELSGLLEREEPEWEIVLVGNYLAGADDRTPEVVRALARGHPRIRAVTRIKTGMMGWDTRTGLAAATGRVLAVIDGDGQMPATDVVRVYRHLRRYGLDFAKTYRTARDDGARRRLISLVYNAVFRLLFPGLDSRDVNSKPKMMTREVYDRLDLRSDGWFIDAEIMIQLRRMGLRLGEIGTVFRSLDSRPSFVRPLAILEFIGNLLAYRLRERGRRVLAPRTVRE